MKKLLFILLSVSIVFAACSKEESDEKIVTYIESIEVVSPESSQEVSVDNFTNRIVVSVPVGSDLTQIVLKVNTGAGVSMVTPSTQEATYDLSSEKALVVLANKKQVTFKIKAGFYYPEITEAIKGWELCTEYAPLPDYLKVYRIPSPLFNKNIVGYIAVADMSRGARFAVVGEKTGLNTPSGYFAANGNPAVIMNAGYFYSTSALSLICRNSQILCSNISSMTRSDGVSNASFYPTRSVFGMKTDGTFTADWIYTAEGTTYAYPAPSPNKAGSAPQAQPSATFPAGAWVWSAQTAVGAGPMLLKNGEIKNTWEAELCDAASGIGPTANNPRSAIGITRYNHLVFFVCEGRNMTTEVPGLTLEEVAQILKDLGCVDAINLDGGGSSCMLINGQETIKPSDKTQRSVSSCVVMK